MKIGIIGVGRHGEIHIKCIQQIENLELVGFYDIDKNRSKLIEEKYNIKSFDSREELIKNIAVLDIVTPTTNHFESAIYAINNNIHVFMEKPVVKTMDQAYQLINHAKNSNVKIQVGHVERFNPAFIAAKEYIENPKYIECQRLTKFSNRSFDVSVVIDLMIHDIDIVLSTVNSKVKSINAIGLSVINKLTDYANAYIEFENGCTANLSASRVSSFMKRQSSFINSEKHINVDFLNKTSNIIYTKNTKDKVSDKYEIIIPNDGGENKEIQTIELVTNEINAIKEELQSFIYSIHNNSNPIVSLIEGCEALDIAHTIMEQINNNK